MASAGGGATAKAGTVGGAEAGGIESVGGEAGGIESVGVGGAGSARVGSGVTRGACWTTGVCILEVYWTMPRKRAAVPSARVSVTAASPHAHRELSLGGAS